MRFGRVAVVPVGCGGIAGFPAGIAFRAGYQQRQIGGRRVLFKEGRENQTLQAILDKAPYNETSVATQLMLIPRGLLPILQNRFYTYAGSSTTPPCSEGINWHVLSQPVEASASQIQQFGTFYSDNARHAQPLNTRIVYLKPR